MRKQVPYNDRISHESGGTVTVNILGLFCVASGWLKSCSTAESESVTSQGKVDTADSAMSE